MRNLVALFSGASGLEEDAIFHVVLELPRVDGVRFLDVDDVERDTIAIIAIETVERGHRPAERRSSVAAEDEDDRPIASIGRKRHAPSPILRRPQIEIWSGIAFDEITAASPQPHALRGKPAPDNKRRHSFHERTEAFRCLRHRNCDRAAERDVDGDKGHDGAQEPLHVRCRLILLRGAAATRLATRSLGP